MKDLNHLFENNARWAEAIQAEQPDFFEQLSHQQAPEYLWIGCADSRVPANQIVGLMPGEMFVHRNIANCVVNTDLNCLSVISFAVQVLKVKHIIVTGHYGCGGVKAALENAQLGLPDHWIRNVRDVYYQNRAAIDDIDNPALKLDALCELNVKHQVANVCHIPDVQNAWAQGQSLTIHGWIYGIKDGLLKKLTDPIRSIDAVSQQHRVIKT